MERAQKKVVVHETNGSSNGVTNSSMSSNGIHGDRQTKSNQITFFARHFRFTLIPLFLLLTCPNAMLMLWYTAVHCDGSYLKLTAEVAEKGVVGFFQELWSGVSLGSPLTTCVLIGYSIFAAFLHLVLPGPRAEGPTTPKGNVPVYKDNGFACYVVTMVTFCGLTYVLKQYGISPTIVYDHFDDFLGSMTVYSLIVCVLLYFKGLLAPSTTDSGSSGNIVFDYYWGTELYPRIGNFDMKVFTNCRFGMTVWSLLVLIFSLKSFELHGFVDGTWVSCFLHFVYFTKFFWWEAGYMRTIDIMVDRAGFYICWGCMNFIPGLYASTSLYLVNHPVLLGPILSIFILVAGTTSTIINYAADLQKLQVRQTDGKCLVWGKPPKVIRAKYWLESGEQRESLLLVSGWWGVARHFHYVPELALAFFWCLPGLFENVMCYTYFIWLVVLLSHRTFRDDEKCSAKYGKYWKQYCKAVPYRMIPYVF